MKRENTKTIGKGGRSSLTFKSGTIRALRGTVDDGKASWYGAFPGDCWALVFDNEFPEKCEQGLGKQPC